MSVLSSAALTASAASWAGGLGGALVAFRLGVWFGYILGKGGSR